MTPTTPPPDLIDLAEASKRCNVSPYTLLSHIHAGTLQATDFTPPNPNRKGRGRRTYRIEATELERFIAACKTRPAAPPLDDDRPPRPQGRPKAGTVKPSGLLGDFENRNWRKK